jgi:hypothetical protein
LPPTSRSRTKSFWPSLAVLALASARPEAARAQQEREWRLQALGTAARAPESFLGGGLGLILRNRTRTGAGVSAVVGLRDGNLAGRGEALLSFSLDPLRERGVAPYLAGGVAVVGDRVGTEEYLVAVLGLALNPGRGTGWFVEAGVGGGVRVAAGFAVRHRRVR